jgi:hypothetical protein
VAWTWIWTLSDFLEGEFAAFAYALEKHFVPFALELD